MDLSKSLKTDVTWRHNWVTRRESKIALFEFINGFYNPRRRNSAIGWKSPLAFEKTVEASLARLSPANELRRRANVGSWEGLCENEFEALVSLIFESYMSLRVQFWREYIAVVRNQSTKHDEYTE